MAISTYDDLFNARKQTTALSKTALSSAQMGGIGFFSSFWVQAGTPTAGTNPSAATSYTNATGGSIFTDLTASKKFLSRLSMSSQGTIGTTFFLVDRLVSTGPISIQTTGVKTVNTPALPSIYSSGDGVFPAYEMVSGASTSATVELSNYTSSTTSTGGGAALRAGSTTAFPSLGTAGILLPNLANGDIGVRSVEEINVSATSISGVINVSLYYLLGTAFGGSSRVQESDFFGEYNAMQRVRDGATLMILALRPLAAATTPVCGFIEVLYG